MRGRLDTTFGFGWMDGWIDRQRGRQADTQLSSIQINIRCRIQDTMGAHTQLLRLFFFLEFLQEYNGVRSFKCLYQSVSFLFLPLLFIFCVGANPSQSQTNDSLFCVCYQSGNVPNPRFSVPQAYTVQNQYGIPHSEVLTEEFASI